MPRSASWTPEEDARLQQMRGAEGWPFDRIAKALGRTACACVCRFRLLRRTGGDVQYGKTTSWTEEELAWLRAHYGAMTARECAEHLGRSEMSVAAKAGRLGLAKSRAEEPELEPEPEIQKPKKRRCHDCGRPTTDFRCPKCWAKLRANYDYEE